jgi:hypothetical protein
VVVEEPGVHMEAKLVELIMVLLVLTVVTVVEMVEVVALEVVTRPMLVVMEGLEEFRVVEEAEVLEHMQPALAIRELEAMELGAK